MFIPFSPRGVHINALSEAYLLVLYVSGLTKPYTGDLQSSTLHPNFVIVKGFALDLSPKPETLKPQTLTPLISKPQNPKPKTPLNSQP